ncbi:hypothetical protein TWF506_003164 [Arthrobotrys conoides]|uniref:Uncharacterized protein n=1 Tax=Arthrobotrys conoides TaxID=74498 RepID=A0AAN8N8H9_9PEZI
MRSSSLSFVVLWALAGSTFALNEADTRGVGSNLAARDIDTDDVPSFGDPDSLIDLDSDILDEGWDENLALRSIAPEIFGNQESHAVSKIKKRGLLPALSYNVHPQVVADQPRDQRRNSAREHWEYLCNWRSPREDFNIRFAYGLFTDYLEQYENAGDWCSGPNNFCTKVWCHSRYFVEVCNYGETPWQVLCSNIISVARDIITAKANQDPAIWEDGFPEIPRSKQQQINDRKKICINHSAVYQPEALGLGFFNTLPRWFVRVSYGYSPDRVSCKHEGIQADVKRAAASQEQYMKDWYDKIQISEIDGGDDEKGGRKGAKPAGKTPKVDGEEEEEDDNTKGRYFPPKGSKNDTDAFGLPFYKDVGGTYPALPNLTEQAIHGFTGPPMSNYDPQDFIIPGLEDYYSAKNIPKNNLNVSSLKLGKQGSVGSLKPAGGNELSLDDGDKKGSGKGGIKKVDLDLEIPTKSVESMWFKPGHTSQARIPKHRNKAPSVHWSMDTTGTWISHHTSSGGSAPTPKPVKGAKQETATAAGMETPEKTIDAAAATATTAAKTSAVDNDKAATTAPAAPPATTAPPATEPTSSAAAKADGNGDASAAVPTIKPSPSGEIASAKAEPKPAKDEPTPAMPEPTAAKQEPAPPKPEPTAPKAEPTPAKDEAKPTTPEKEEVKPAPPAKDEAKPTIAAEKDEAKPTTAPTPSA